jgi:two-component system OmpR family response regulator
MQQVMIEAAGLKLDPAGCVVYRKGSIIHLGRRETLALEMLMLAEGRVVTIRELLDHAWSGEGESVARVRGVVQRLRNKLRAPNLILTIGREGYCLGNC